MKEHVRSLARVHPLKPAIEDADALTIALLATLGELDAAGAAKGRTAKVRECLDMIQQLEGLGGGSLGTEKLTALHAALSQEVGG